MGEGRRSLISILYVSLSLIEVPSNFCLAEIPVIHLFPAAAGG